ncbi:sodium:solute symporter family protein [Lawsonibacter hominis]|uniref:sodium:solute symporter family protein n=1 Tax=Lawsonibacter hominis TaxID=2763053 RepID=UPI00332805D4
MNVIVIGIVAALVLYGVFVFGISVKASKTTSTSTDYLVAGRNVGTITLVATVALSIWSALAFYGYGAGLYRQGIGYWIGAMGACFVGFFAPTIMYRLWLLGKQYGYTTPGDFFMHRYGSRALKLLISAICVVCIVPYISVQISGVANGIVTTTQGKIGFWVCVAVLVVYMYVHVLGGGNKAVVGTDLFAAIVGIAIVILTTIVFIVNICNGSLSAATEKIIADGNIQVLQVTGRYTNWVSSLGLSISAGISIIAWPHIFIRSYMAKSEDVFKVMGTAFPILELISFGCFMIQGIWAGRYAYPALEGAASDSVIPRMALEYAPAILAILLVIGVFAFGLSTADSQLVVASSIVTHDVVRKEGRQEENTKRNNAIVLTIFMAAVLVVTYFRPAFLVTYAYSFCAPGFAQMMPALIGGLYWKRGTKQGALAGTIVGMVAVLATLFLSNPIPALDPILWGLILNAVVYVLVSLATAQDERAAREINEPLSKFFASRESTGHKVLLVLYVVVFVQCHIVGVNLPQDGFLFGWMPPTVFNYVLSAVELAVLGYFYGKNRLYEPDGSKKEFAPFCPHDKAAA